MLVYQDIGKGIPIVFIHGLGSKKEAWEPQHELAHYYRLIIPDLRGHGETEIERDISVNSFALDIIQLLEYLEIPSAYICGLSLGGIIAQEIYRCCPDMVKGLILANTTAYIPSLLSFHTIYLSQQLFLRDKQKLLAQIVETSLYDQSYRDEAAKVFHLRDTYIQCAIAPVGINYYPVLPFIKKPVLLIGSTHDKVTPLINLVMMRRFIKDSHYVSFKHTGHLSNIEQKDSFNQTILRFIEKIA